MVLDRRMFRRPSATPPEKGPSSRGVGITSGLTQPVRGYKYGDFVETLESTSEELYPVLKKYFPEENLQFVLIGKADEIREQIKKYGGLTEKEIKADGF